MKLTALAAASAAALILTGCTVSAPPATLSQPQTPPTVQQPATTTVPDETAYLDGLAGGTSPAGLVSTHAELRAATLEAGYGACNLIDAASSPSLGMLQVLEFAELHLTDAPFTADMPVLFTASASVHLCGVTP